MNYFWKNLLFSAFLFTLSPPLQANTYTCKPILSEDLFPQLRPILNNLSQSHSTALAIQEEKIIEAQGKALISQSAVLPRIYGSYNFNETYQNQEHQSGTTRLVHYGSVNLTQPLYHWGAKCAEKQNGAINLGLAQAEYEHFLENLKKQMREVFLEICLIKKSLELDTLKLELTEKRLNSKNEYKLHGKTTDLDYAEDAIQIDQLKNNIKQTNNRLHQLTSRYFQITGETWTFDDVTIDPFSLLETLKAKVSACPLPHNVYPYEYRQLEKILCIEKNEYTRIHAQSLPLINFQGGFYQDVVDSINSNAQDNRYNFYGGINITWNIFDGCSTMGQKLASKARQRIIRLRMKEALLNHELLMEDFESRLQESFEKILLMEKEVYLREQRLQEKLNLYEENRITRMELEEYESFKKHSEYGLLAAIITYLNQSNEFYIKTQ